MARIVITSWGSYGDLYPYIGLGIALRRRGHRPVLAMPGLYRELVEREGLEFHPVRPDLDVHDRALAARLMDSARGAEAIFGEVLVPHLAETHADLMRIAEGADLLVSHPATPAAPIVAAERGLLWASSVLAPMSFFSTLDPVVPPPAPWLHGLLTRSVAISRLFLRLTDRLTSRWAEPIQRFRESRGLGRGGNPILEGQHSPHLVLALFSQMLARPQADWPANVSIAGPILYNGHPGGALPPDVSRFLDAGEPPIVFTLGTSAVFAAGAFYDVSAEVATRLRRRAVLLVGPHAENRPGHATPDTFVTEFASHALLFARAAVIVHQGGAGTLHQALASGKPQLVVPHSHDQPDNARRVAALGVARILFPYRYRAARLERELRTLLGEPRYARRASEVAQRVCAEDGPGHACDAIESLLAAPPHAAQT